MFALAILIMGAVTLWRLPIDGYLEPPFYFRVNETLMDLFEPAYWANNGGAYKIWHALYPPLSFIFLKALSIRECYVRGAAVARLCDWRSILALIFVFCCNILLVLRCYRLAVIPASISRTVAVCLGLPMLYALERGNLLIPCFTCFVLAFGDIMRWRGARWLAMALAINFKPYLVFSLLPFVGRRTWLGLIVFGLLFVSIYGLTYFIAGSGSPLEVIANESRYAGVKSVQYFSDLYFATSYWPLIRLLSAAPSDLVLLPPGVALTVRLILEIALRLAQCGFALCSAIALFRPSRVDIRRFGAMVACISLVAFTTGSAGYVQIFLFFLLFYEPWSGRVRIAILSCAYVLCMPTDYVFLPFIHQRELSFLTGRSVIVESGVSIGQLLRPGLLLVIQYGLIVINLIDLLTSSDRTLAAREPGWFSSLSSLNSSRPPGSQRPIAVPSEP